MFKPSLMVFFVVVLTLSACAKQSESTTSTSAAQSPAADASATPTATSGADATASPAAVPTATATADASAAPILTPTPAQTALIAATATPLAVPATPAPTPIATPTPKGLVTFNDVKGIFAQSAIEQEATLGIFGKNGPAFHPLDPITRGDYIRWLVTANNLYFANNNAKIIRLAEGRAQDFVDVPPSDPNYTYIQGMSDAGFIIGYDKTHFRPSQNLKREELAAIMVNRSLNGSSGTTASGPPDYSDGNQVTKAYWGAFRDDQGCCYKGNIARTFGTVRAFHPLRDATRGEAAVSIQYIDGITAENALAARKRP